MTPLAEILDLARWAPSGDNTQPWRFRIASQDRVVVQAFDTREHCVYDLDGHASQLSVGAMLETLRIAAASFGLTARVERMRESPEARPQFDVRFTPGSDEGTAKLAQFIKVRCVQRRPMSPRLLASHEKRTLEACLPAGFTALWSEGWRDRWRVARILWRSAGIRLTIPEGFETHRRVIAWDARSSDDKIPDRAIGLDPLTTHLTRWAMADWKRIEFLNRYLAGTIMPRIQLDLLPGLACAGHVFLVAARAPESIDDYTAAGAAVQRFWLTLASLGLQHQPEMTPLIFARYAREERAFSASPSARPAVEALLRQLQSLLGADLLPRVVWMGRVGAGSPARWRSMRLPLEALMLPSEPARRSGQ